MLTSNLSLQRSNSLTSLNSTVNDGSNLNTKDETTNEDYLRICLCCAKILQKRYDQIRFKDAEKDEVFLCYEVNCFDIC